MAYNKLNRVAACLLLLVYVTSAVTTRELLKLPLLAEHFHDHKSANVNTSLYSFLVFHYLYEKDMDNDAEKDRKLPFKSIENNATPNVVSLKPPVQHYNLSGKQRLVNLNFHILDDRLAPSLFCNAVWHPPRGC